MMMRCGTTAQIDEGMCVEKVCCRRRECVMDVFRKSKSEQKSSVVVARQVNSTVSDFPYCREDPSALRSKNSIQSIVITSDNSYPSDCDVCESIFAWWRCW